MKTKLSNPIALLALFVTINTSTALAQATAFTYQGQLNIDTGNALVVAGRTFQSQLLVGTGQLFAARF